MKRIVAASIAAIAILAAIVPGALSATHRSHAKHPPTPAASQSTSQVTVWVNLNSGIYHYPGERWYGRTKNGQYMKESDAIKAGYRATENGQ